MKKLFSLLIVSLVSTSLFAQTASWKVDPMHSQLSFSTTHLGISDVDGLFKKFDATATGSAADFSDAVFTLWAAVNNCNFHSASPYSAMDKRPMIFCAVSSV